MSRPSLFLVAFLSASIVAAQTLTIPAGTAIRIRTTQAVSSATARVGDDVSMEVLADVAVNDYLVIRQGAPVIAVVSVAKEAKTIGRRGHVAVALKYASAVTGEHVLVTGDRQEEGNGKKAKMIGEVAVTALLSPAGSLLWLFEKGNDSMIQPGTAFTVYTAADTTLDLGRLPPGTVLLRARPGGPENLPILGLVVDSNPANFLPTITGMVKDGPADHAGLRVGYLITAVNRVETRNVRDLIETLAAVPPDATTIKLGRAFQSNLGLMPKEVEVRIRQ